MLRHLMALFILALIALPLGVAAQDIRLPENSTPGAIDRASTGGAQNLADIEAREAGVEIDDSFRRDNLGGDAATAPGLGPLGGRSDPDLWRGIRYNELPVTVSTLNQTGLVLVQDDGIWWLNFREGPLATYGAWLLGGMLILLALFYLLRGRIRIEGGKSGRTVTRFKAIERFAHWMLAGSFILLALTGLATLFGRKVVIPTLGHDFNSVLLAGSKFIHNNVSWAFMIALVMVFVMWVWHNIPNRTDWVWIKQGGGFIGDKHPPAKKFNFGQKIIFWGVIVLGFSVSLSGLSLLFPFELHLFGHTFGLINDVGITEFAGMGPLQEDLTPHAEMQYAQLWHAIIGFLMMALILGHIYIGTLGMEGAYDAMGSGEVDERWAEQHHSLWLDEVRQDKRTPAE
ncbi:formate dehydrogenase subunit gamma [Sulfitobacter sp. HNIBRBA3233]|uniref:formate dehydrogenase subunit gamma n=1 Tax=Sulfitobacter marinivivus TaxID=3158558 RepID=UPI0032DEC9BA